MYTYSIQKGALSWRNQGSGFAAATTAHGGAGFLLVDDVHVGGERRSCGARLYTIFLQDVVAE